MVAAYSEKYVLSVIVYLDRIKCDATCYVKEAAVMLLCNGLLMDDCGQKARATEIRFHMQSRAKLFLISGKCGLSKLLSLMNKECK